MLNEINFMNKTIFYEFLPLNFVMYAEKKQFNFLLKSNNLDIHKFSIFYEFL